MLEWQQAQAQANATLSIYFIILIHLGILYVHSEKCYVNSIKLWEMLGVLNFLPRDGYQDDVEFIH
jgi:hypothetical protein